jgi:hypothetical protein
MLQQGNGRSTKVIRFCINHGDRPKVATVDTPFVLFLKLFDMVTGDFNSRHHGLLLTHQKYTSLAAV